MTGSALVLGDDRSPDETHVQREGEAYWITADNLRRVLDGRPRIRHLMLRYVRVLLLQFGQVSLANGRADVSTRLARWLAMAQDRSESPELRLTHDTIAFFLGVRRASVTVAMHRLEAEGAIRNGGRVVTITDREKLLAAAAFSYGVPEAVYLRLLGNPYAEPAAADTRYG